MAGQPQSCAWGRERAHGPLTLVHAGLRLSHTDGGSKVAGSHRDRAVAGNAHNGGERHQSRWRITALAIAALLLVPLIAMQVTDEVNWEPADFAAAAALLTGMGVAFQFAMRKADNSMYRAAVGVALAAAFILVWANAAVGIIGSESNDANLMYGGVLAVGLIGAVLARLRPGGMARTLFATALAQALVAVIALLAGLGSPETTPLQIVLLNGFFVALFTGSALLFREAARRSVERTAGQHSL